MRDLIQKNRRHPSLRVVPQAIENGVAPALSGFPVFAVGDRIIETVGMTASDVGDVIGDGVELAYASAQSLRMLSLLEALVDFLEEAGLQSLAHDIGAKSGVALDEAVAKARDVIKQATPP